MDKFIFNEGKLNNNLQYVYSYACKEYKTFRFEKDCAVNEKGNGLNGYQYISLVTKKKYAVGTKVRTQCLFEAFGAPLIVLTNEIEDAEGKKFFGLHFEIVAYEDGCNIWHISKGKDDKPTNPVLIASSNFKIENGRIFDISVEILNKKIVADINGNRIEVEHVDIPETFHVGITACEGINRFYELLVK